MEEYNQLLLECARYGEPEDLIKLLGAGADVNYSDSTYLTSPLVS